MKPPWELYQDYHLDTAYPTHCVSTLLTIHQLAYLFRSVCLVGRPVMNASRTRRVRSFTRFSADRLPVTFSENFLEQIAEVPKINYFIWCEFARMKNKPLQLLALWIYVSLV